MNAFSYRILRWKILTKALAHASRKAFTRADLLAVVGVLALLALVLTPALARTGVSDKGFVCLNHFRQLGLGWLMYAADNQNKLATTFEWVGGDLSYGANNPDNTNINYLIGSGLLAPYVKDPGIYKCLTDQSVADEAGAILPRVRSVSMNQAVCLQNNQGWITSPPWNIFNKSSDMVNPIPANLWVFLDENPDSINDGAFAINMQLSWPTTGWGDGPTLLHAGGCSFGFADGHAQIHRWTDPRTLGPSMQTTYQYGFAFGQVQPQNLDVQWLELHTTAHQ